jgi:hypothetical protein
MSTSNDLYSQTSFTSQTLEESNLPTTSSESLSADIPPVIREKCLTIINDYKSGTLDKASALLELIKTIPPQQDDSDSFRTAFSAYCGMLDGFDRYRDAARSRGIERDPSPTRHELDVDALPQPAAHDREVAVDNLFDHLAVPTFPQTTVSPGAPKRCTNLHVEFRTIVLLLALITATNNGGHSALVDAFDEEYYGALESAQQSIHTLILNSAAAIIVRDTEFVALAGLTPPFPSGASTKPPLNYSPHFLAIQYEQCSKEADAITNPDAEGKCFQFGDDRAYRCVLVKSGTSHWTWILKNPWHGLQLK